MSTAERWPPADIPPLVAGEQLSQAEFHRRYEAMPPQTRAELVGGIVYMPSPMTADHGESTPDVATWLNIYRHRTPGLRLAEGATVILGAFGEPQPDALLRIQPERGGACFVNADNYLTGPPELVAEVAKSSRLFDLGKKKTDYERAGVKEYVVVTIDPDEIHWFVRRGRKLVKMRRDRDGLYRSKVFPGLWLDPAALLRRDLAAVLAALERGLASPEHAAFVAKLAAAARKV
jgi:Putative restriction endonuclease